MPTVFVVFPPAAGGNHLKNIIVSSYQDTDISNLYNKIKKTVHNNKGRNLQLPEVENAVLNQTNIHVLHGHFGEIMSFQTQVRSILDKKFIIVSLETAIDIQQLNDRRHKLGHESLGAYNNYFNGEQVFLYESFMYHYYFNVPEECIMNISVSEWFSKNIDNVIDRISNFLQLPMDKEKIKKIHSMWIEANQ